MGTRQRIAGYTAQARLDNVSLCYSSDGMWIHLCEWASRRNLVIRAIDGLTVELPVQSAAVSWNPRGGASMMTVMTTEHESGDLIVHDYHVSTGILSKRAQLRSLNGIPLNVRELSMSIDECAVVTAPIGVTGMDQLRRGGVYLAAVI